MKKEYNKPELLIAELMEELLIAESPEEEVEGGTGGFVGARDNSTWDDDNICFEF